MVQMTFWTAQFDKKQFLAYTLMEVFKVRTQWVARIA